MTQKKEPRQAAAPFELLLASRPSHDELSGIAMSAAVAAHIIAFAAVTVIAGPAAQMAPRSGADVIMLELPTIVPFVPPPQLSSAGVARMAGDPASKWIGTHAIRTAPPAAPDLPPIDWSPPPSTSPTPASDAIFTSNRLVDTGDPGAGDEGGLREPGLEELAMAPAYTPFTRGTELENREEVTRYLLGRYPPDLRESRTGGRATLWILVDQKGHARKAILLTSSGFGPLDDAALEATDLMQFAPAWNAGHKVPVWVQLPVTFRVEEGS